MNMQDVKKKAKILDIKPGKRRKADLIRSIQATEGNFACFGYAKDYCDQFKCCWRDDCLTAKNN